MSKRPLRLSLMTAGLTPGDAITNYMMTQARIFREWGVAVELYADNIAPELQTSAQPSRLYQPMGNDLLWYHYSIYADNIQQAIDSPDFKVLDYHGISPPRLFAGQNTHLESLCRQGIALLPSLVETFDQVIVHSEAMKEELLGLGFPADRLHKIYLAVDTSRFSDGEDEGLVEELSRLTYLLMVGRIVPQKDLMALLAIFAHVHAQRPDTVLILAGNREQTGPYQAQLDRFIRTRGLDDRVLFTGQVNNPGVLAALLSQATLLVVTSEWESFCVPIAEALHFGTPAAVQNQPPMTEVAGEGGITFDKHDPEEAAAQILALLTGDKRLKSLQQAALAQSQQYTEAVLADNMLRFLQKSFEMELPLVVGSG